MYPKNPLLVATLNYESIQEDLVLRIIGPEVREKDILIAELSNIAFETIEGGEIFSDHVVDYLCLEEDVAIDLIDTDDLIWCLEVALIRASFDLLEGSQAHLSIFDENNKQIFDGLPLLQKYFFEILIFPRAASNMLQAFSHFLFVLIIHSYILIRHNEHLLVDL